MTTLFGVLLGVLLGAVSAAWHLGWTRWRAGLAVGGRPWLALALAPVGLLGPAAAVLLAARVEPAAAWAVPVGLVALRQLFLARLRRAG
jgi:hypothetical protein